MEILSYVLQGELAHRDNMGHQEILGPNEIQRMSAGSGVVHSEFNGSKEKPVHFFQIWIEPGTRGTPSSSEQIRFDPVTKLGKLKLLAGPKGGDSAATINQDAYVYVAELDGGSVSHDLRPGRHAWLHLVRGDVTVNGAILNGGDAGAISGESSPNVSGAADSEILLFDLA
jgi:redox-sensitive bicupin YhaK (pirin superfamily)